MIRQARVARNVTQAELAHRLGITQSAVAQLERQGSNPTIARVEAALAALDARLELRVTAAPAVDERLLARNLGMTPTERMDAFETAHRELAELRSGMPDVGPRRLGAPE